MAGFAPIPTESIIFSPKACNSSGLLLVLLVSTTHRMTMCLHTSHSLLEHSFEYFCTSILQKCLSEPNLDLKVIPIRNQFSFPVRQKWYSNIDSYVQKVKLSLLTRLLSDDGI